MDNYILEEIGKRISERRKMIEVLVAYCLKEL